jgi:hypothetical protein
MLIRLAKTHFFGKEQEGYKKNSEFCTDFKPGGKV